VRDGDSEGTEALAQAAIEPDSRLKKSVPCSPFARLKRLDPSSVQYVYILGDTGVE
jgi:hypothetical protein